METNCEVYCVASIVAWLLIMGTIVLHYSSPSTYAIALCLVYCPLLFLSFFHILLHTSSSSLNFLLWYITRSVFLLQVLRNTLIHFSNPLFQILSWTSPVNNCFHSIQSLLHVVALQMLNLLISPSTSILQSPNNPQIIFDPI